MGERREMFAAWGVLEDAARSINLAVSADEDHWRVHWAGSLALLRAAGHVLHKVDENRSEAHRKCSKDWWQRWNPEGGTEGKPNIFSDFIEAERNLILKQYKFRFDPADRLGHVFSCSGERIFLRDGTPLLSRNLERFVITDGAYAGRDGRELLREARRWWADQLSELDARVAALRSAGDST
jgi:hypothetical protein